MTACKLLLEDIIRLAQKRFTLLWRVTYLHSFPHTSNDDKGDQPSGEETTWTNTGATRSGRGQHKTV